MRIMLAIAAACVLSGCVTMKCDDTGCTGSFEFPWPEALAPKSAKVVPNPAPIPVTVTNKVTLEK